MILIFLIPAILTALVWWPTLGAKLFADDFAIIKAVADGGIFGLWSSPGHMWFRPLVSVSIWVDQHLWGGAAWGYHVSNLLLHWMNAVLVGVSVILWLRLCEPGNKSVQKSEWLGIIAATAFAILPCHGESVAWIADRTDLLSVFFALGAWNFYLYSRKSGATPWLGWLCFICALATKESVVTLPVAMVLLELHLSGMPRWRRAWILLLPWFLFVLVYIPVRSHFVGTLVGGYGTKALVGISLPHLLLQPFFYVGRMIIPGLIPWATSLQGISLDGWRNANRVLFFIAGAAHFCFSFCAGGGRIKVIKGRRCCCCLRWHGCFPP